MAGRIDELRKRLEAQPASRLFAQLAEELRKDGQLDEAIRVCRDGLRQHPAYASAHMTLGRALFDKGDLGSARHEFESVVSAAPDNILAGRLLGECLEGLGEHAAARKRYETTLLLAPDDPQLVARLEAIAASERRAEGTARHTVPPEGMRRAAAQSVVAAAVASAARGSRTGAPAEAAPSASEDPAGGAAAAAADPAAADAPAGATAAPQSPPAAEAEPTAREAAAEAAGEVEAGGAAASPSPEPETSDPTAGTIPFAEPPDTESERAQSATSKTLPFGTPAPKLPWRRPRPPARDQRRTETTPVSVESVKRALAETEAAEAAAGGEIATPTLAELYLKQGHPEKAAEVYRSILQRDPADADVRARLERLEREQAERSARRGRLEEGIARLERLLVAVQRARRA